jgi:hypothetical protein
MPYSVEYDPLGIITIKVQGALTMTAVRDFTVEAVQLAKEKDCFRVLTDLQEATLNLSILELYNLPNLTAEIASTAGLQIYQFKRALVVLHDEKLAPFFENVSRNRHQNVRLFHDVESAWQWLLER